MNLIYPLIGLALLLAGCATTETAKPKKENFDGMDFETILANANEGNLRAQVKVARMYDNGDGVEKSPVRAVSWTRKAAIKGDPEAETMLGLAYARGIGGLGKSLLEARKWFTKAAENGDVNAMQFLSGMIMDGEGGEKNPEEGAKWLMKAAEIGNAGGQHKLGHLYEDGEGVEKDLAKAFEWFLKSAEQGDAVAQLHVADYYSEGKGVEKDRKKKTHWLKKSAAGGNATAQRAYGIMQIFGEGVEKNIEHGEALLNQAAIKGDLNARFRLGVLYLDDKHQRKNLQLAYFWFTLAGEKHQLAKQGLANVNAEIQPDEMLRALDMVSDFKNNPPKPTDGTPPAEEHIDALLKKHGDKPSESSATDE